MFPILAQIRAEVTPQGFPILPHRLELMAPEAIELCRPTPEGPFPLDGAVGRGVVRWMHRLAPAVLFGKAGVKINIAPNVLPEGHHKMKMQPAVAMPFRDCDAAQVTPGDNVGQQGMKPPLCFLPLSQVAESTARVHIPQSQSEEADPLPP